MCFFLICRSVENCKLLPLGQADEVLAKSVQTNGERRMALGVLHRIEKDLAVDNTYADVKSALLEVPEYKRAEDVGALCRREGEIKSACACPCKGKLCNTAQKRGNTRGIGTV